MSILVARHAFSEANNRDNIGTLAFASMEAPLMELGYVHSAQLQQTLQRRYGIHTADMTVATSELRRTQETALRAGFTSLVPYAVLNEVAHGVVLPELRGMLDQHVLPAVVITAANRVLETPPAQEIWITHGLVIAGLCRVLGVYTNDRLIPRFCEVRELPM